ncbi:4Fe-4S double cluster binding domain-containing protein [Spirochaetia bacterium 38H-sp]|uniref:4Fe-4S double cluster binding domain-containing protein n=1 Tax=Rarispira pelagica TaxID=3141764 RepID=A0ABU9UA85_9SPIR
MNYSDILEYAEEAGIKHLSYGKTDKIEGISNKYPFFLISFIPYSLQGKEKYISDRACADIAPFAQANHYAELTARFKKLVSAICIKTGYKKADFRIFSNSPFPEKQMAVKSGLGVMGKNGLIINKTYGSYISIGGVLLPFIPKGLPEMQYNSPGCDKDKETWDDYRQQENTPLCKTCAACITACPTKAITEKGLQKERCIQYYASTHTIVPQEIMEKWGTTLYGCPHCQAACPHNRKDLQEREKISLGRIGSTLPLDILISSSPEHIKQLIKKSTLASSWLDTKTLIRNAIIVAGYLRCKSLSPAIEEHTHSHDSVIRDAATWAKKQIAN